jgi:hypothetical protein
MPTFAIDGDYLCVPSFGFSLIRFYDDAASTAILTLHTGSPAAPA